MRKGRSAPELHHAEGTARSAHRAVRVPDEADHLAGLDAFAQGLGDSLAGTGIKVIVVRPGFVHTKMTTGMKAAPFSTTPENVADLLSVALANGHEVVWAPPILKYPFFIFRLLPRAVWRKVSERG